MQHSPVPMFRWPESLWAHTAPTKELNPPLEGEIQTDVTIIGAGFTGLRAALALAQAGSSVAVLDTGDVGWGASGRTGGQVNPMLPFNSPKKLRELVGSRYFDRITEASLNSADELFALIAEHKIECQARQNGWLRVLHNRRAHRKAETDVKEWNAFGADMALADGPELRRLSGTGAYGQRGNCLTRGSGSTDDAGAGFGRGQPSSRRPHPWAKQGSGSEAERREMAGHNRPWVCDIGLGDCRHKRLFRSTDRRSESAAISLSPRYRSQPNLCPMRSFLTSCPRGIRSRTAAGLSCTPGANPIIASSMVALARSGATGLFPDLTGCNRMHQECFRNSPRPAGATGGAARLL